MSNVKELVAQLTLEEKAGLCSGADFWHTKAVERLNIPASMVSDGPHGLRKQDMKVDHLGISESNKAVCFPAGCSTAASFNKELLTQMGAVLGEECQAEGVSILLGPAVNIKRSPLCGRNFEYFSEDPYLAGEMAGSFIKGVQSKNVGTSIKHFLANNQEHRRMSSSSEIDERTLREIYLAAFEGAIRSSKPWTVMCSYNRINGVYAAENKTYLTDVLRGEWGFDGYVMSDWGAVNERVKDLAAGLDLEMPSCGEANDKRIVDAVKEGRLSMEVLDTAVERILNIVFRFEEGCKKDARLNLDADHEKAREIAGETIVLLKNEGVLPLARDASIAFIGKYAREPRFQGGGSSHINCHKITSALDAVANMTNITYSQGFRDEEDKVDEVLLAQACEAAGKASCAVIFAGLPDSFESEGYDRTHMSMPNCQNELISAVAKVQPNTIVVLHNGSPVEMPWANQVKGILEAYLSGQASGGAVVDILFGDVNPSAKLPETFPHKLEDNPSYLYYLGEGDQVEYREGVFVGYRYYDTKKMDVLFPFGHGLSYTTFSYSNLTLSAEQITDSDTLTLSLDITNTGSLAGKEIVQIYVAPPADSKVLRPAKELRAFDKIFLEPGETKTLTFTLGKRAFSYWDTSIHDWYAESGTYEILAASSSRNILQSAKVQVTASKSLPFFITPDTCIGDLLEHPIAGAFMEPYRAMLHLLFPSKEESNPPEESSCAEGSSSAEGSSCVFTEDMLLNMTRFMPLRGLVSFGNGHFSYEDVEKLVGEINTALTQNS